MSLLHSITGRPWLVTDETLSLILEVANREQHDLAAAKAAQEARREALAVRDGRPLDNARYTSVRDGVAVIEVVGPIFRYANLFTSFSGGTATELLAQDLRVALDDPSVRAILFAFDSPGGDATGINEFAQQIYDARGTKPLTAYVGGMAASAAYWMASACDEIVIDATGEVGSIGAVIALPNPAARSSREIEIVSSQSPNKRPDPSTEKGRAAYQARVDALAQVFVESVARNRGVSVETVLKDFGQGGIFTGQAAIAAGLADRIGSYEATLTELAQRTQPQSLYGRPRGAAAEEPMDFKAFFKGMFAAAAEVEAEQAPAQPSVSPEEQAAAAAYGAEAQAELEQLRAQIAEREQAEALATAEAERAAAEQLQARATAFAAAQIDASRALPADTDALTAIFTACAKAGCSEQLTVLFAGRPAHQVTTEVLPVGGHEALEADRGASDATAQRAQAESLMAQTPLGQAALNRRKAK